MKRNPFCSHIGLCICGIDQDISIKTTGSTDDKPIISSGNRYVFSDDPQLRDHLEKLKQIEDEFLIESYKELLDSM